MNVTIIGYGKMGKEIENVLISRGHNINKIIDKDSEISFENTEIAIIFTSPESTFEQIKNCLDANVRVVCGSTGWTQQLDEIENYCRKSNQCEHLDGKIFIFAELAKHIYSSRVDFESA